MTEAPMKTVVSALVAKLGGQVHITFDELRAAEDMELERTKDDGFSNYIGLRVRSNVTLDGVLAGETLEIEEHSA